MNSQTAPPPVPREFVLSSKSGRMKFSGAPKLVGILNVTPDSFYDGGRHENISKAVEHGLEMFSAGASWVDVGGMSTRPGSDEIPVDEEIRRVEPVIAALATSTPPLPKGGQGGVSWISIDTYRSAVAERAIAAGASCINDVSGFSLDPEMCAFAASANCPVVVNHMKGSPKTMQAAPRYDFLWDELLRFFEERAEMFVKAGGDESHLIFDPGIGFGKTREHNLEILRGLDRLHSLGRPIFLGCSRKSFISSKSPDSRLPGSLAAAAIAALRGVHFLRVHDVAETAQFLQLFLTAGPADHG